MYRCLAEQKSDVKEALRDKCLVINNVQYEMSELKKHILVLLGVLADEQPGIGPSTAVTTTSDQLLFQPVLPSITSTSSSSSYAAAPSEHDKFIWMSRNKTIEENFKKELKKVKELERQLNQATETLLESEEKNAFIEEENNIQREQIALLEDTVRDLEETVLRTEVEVEDVATQTEVRGEQLLAIMNENVEEIVCLVSKLAELQQQNALLEGKYEESRKELSGLRNDFHERGKLMSELENELNALKLRDRSGDRCERRRRRRSSSVWDVEPRVSDAVINLDASVFLSPNSSRSCSSNSSADFEEEESGITLVDEQEEEKKVSLVVMMMKWVYVYPVFLSPLSRPKFESSFGILRIGAGRCTTPPGVACEYFLFFLYIEWVGVNERIEVDFSQPHCF